MLQGISRNTENSTEEREWVILEDNFSDELTLVNEIDYISHNLINILDGF